MALVELARFYNSFEAGIVQSRLEADGIASVLFDLNVAMGEGISLAVPIRLMVDEEDREGAQAILAEDHR
jgi:Putative prokaryotic signal transducing protein